MPRCFWNNKLVTLYLRGTPEGIRVFENEHGIKVESEDENDKRRNKKAFSIMVSRIYR